MIISEARFASAYRLANGTEKVFDDVGEMLKHGHKTGELADAEAWVHDFETEPSSYYPLVQSLVDLGRGRGNPPLTGEDSLHVLKVVFSAYEAAETGVSQPV